MKFKKNNKSIENKKKKKKSPAKIRSLDKSEYSTREKERKK